MRDAHHHSIAQCQVKFFSVMGDKDKHGKWSKIWELYGAGVILLRVHSWIL